MMVTNNGASLEVCKAIQVKRFYPCNHARPETHLEFTVWYQARDGQTRWTNGTLAWNPYEDAESLQQDVLALQTEFVRQQWVRIEVCIPNRDSYGNLNPGFIKDTGLLLTTRQIFNPTSDVSL